MTETEYYINMCDISERISASCEQAYILGAHANEVKYKRLLAFVRDVKKALDYLDIQQNSAFHYNARELLKELGEDV